MRVTTVNWFFDYSYTDLHRDIHKDIHRNLHGELHERFILSFTTDTNLNLHKNIFISKVETQNAHFSRYFQRAKIP